MGSSPTFGTLLPETTHMQPPANSPLALLLIAHGSRHGEANADLHWLAEELSRDTRYHAVVASFLELAEPNIEEGGHRCVASGAKRVMLVPYFLSAGVHVRRDLEEYRRKWGEAHPGVEFTLAEPLGRHPLLVEVVRQRIESATSSSRDELKIAQH